jgi:hypothetical protein
MKNLKPFALLSILLLSPLESRAGALSHILCAISMGSMLSARAPGNVNARASIMIATGRTTLPSCEQREATGIQSRYELPSQESAAVFSAALGQMGVRADTPRSRDIMRAMRAGESIESIVDRYSNSRARNIPAIQTSLVSLRAKLSPPAIEAEPAGASRAPAVVAPAE